MEHYLRQGKHDEALQRCQELIAVNPLIADYHSLLALVQLERDLPEAAFDALRRAVYCDPDSITAYYLWWLIGLRHHGVAWERTQWAKRHLTRLLANSPDTQVVLSFGAVTAGDVRYLLERNWDVFKAAF